MAFCTKCGAQIADGTQFCPVCGAPQGQPEAPAPQYQQPQYEQPQYQQPQAAADPQQSSLAGSCLTLGIVAIILSELGLPGLILSIIAKNKVKAYESAYGPATGKAKVGKILSNIALPISIVMMGVWVIYIIVIAVGGAAANAYITYYR